MQQLYKKYFFTFPAAKNSELACRSPNNDTYSCETIALSKICKALVSAHSCGQQCIVYTSNSECCEVYIIYNTYEAYIL